MRPWTSATLAFLLLLQWGLALFSCFSLTNRIESLYAMDAREAAIAHRLQESFDLSHGVRIAREDEPGRRGAFYGNDPLFVEYDGTDTIRYQLLPPANSFENPVVDWLGSPLPFQQDPRQTSLNSFFPKFFTGSPVALVATSVPGHTPACVISSSPLPCYWDVPTPPPKDLLS